MCNNTLLYTLKAIITYDDDGDDDNVDDDNDEDGGHDHGVMWVVWAWKHIKK